MKKYTGAQIVWETLLREGVTTVYGYPGGAITPIYDTMLDYPIHHVLVRHEQGASHMADGYARASGKTGVALATSGPGITNMVTGIATAMLDSVPIVCISGQVTSNLLGYDAFQEVDAAGVTIPITKHNYLVTDVKELGTVLKEAFYIARTGRPGPVLIDIPKDVQNASTEWDYDQVKIYLPGYKEAQPPKQEDLKAFAELLADSRKPLILAGRGVLQSNAIDQVVKFAEKADIPVTTTLLGIGAFPSSHPLHQGMMGMHGNAWANVAIQEADLLLAFGMRFDDRVTGKTETYATKAKKVHIDIDASEINKNVKVDLGICGDLKAVLEGTLPLIKSMQHDEWKAEIKANREVDESKDVVFTPDSSDSLSAAKVIYDIWKYTEGKALVVSDVGQHQMWVAQYYKQDNPMKMLTSGGFGTMGFALPAAIGAKMACPDEEVWVIAGDGSFQMTQAELSTLQQEGLKINIAIINNGFLGMVRQWQELFFNRRYAATPIGQPDFLKLADAHGIKGLRVTQRDEVEEAIKQARNSEGPILIDFRVEAEENVFPMVPSGANLDEMIRQPETKQA